MISQKKHRQQGATLLVGMIMMVVLTLLVVFAIRSGNTNLRIAGNMQTQAEATAATQQVIEQVIAQAKVAENMSLIASQTLPVSISNVTYSVAVSALNRCLVEVPVLNSALDSTKANDVACFESPDEDKALKADGSLTIKPSACKTQQRDIEATVTQGTSGTKASHVQGISVRVSKVVDCQ